MKLTIVGMDFVGLVNAVGFAEKGHQVFALDSDKKKIAAFRRNEVFDAYNIWVRWWLYYVYASFFWTYARRKSYISYKRVNRKTVWFDKKCFSRGISIL